MESCGDLDLASEFRKTELLNLLTNPLPPSASNLCSLLSSFSVYLFPSSLPSLSIPFLFLPTPLCISRLYVILACIGRLLFLYCADQVNYTSVLIDSVESLSTSPLMDRILMLMIDGTNSLSYGFTSGFISSVSETILSANISLQVYVANGKDLFGFY